MKAPPNPAITKLSADYYMDNRTGEVKEFTHTTVRSESKESVSQSLRKLRDLINANVEQPENVLWVTLTYRENMRDTKRLYEDFRRFWLRFKYYLRKQEEPNAEYIVAAEPQARGAWHLHGLFIFPEKAPFIPNTEMEVLWKQGFTKTTSLHGIGNPGLYLTAYLGDMELGEAMAVGKQKGQLKEVQDAKGESKAVVKGARLHLYPAGFNLFRSSRGVKRPIEERTTEGEAMKLVENKELVYEKTISVTNGAGDVMNVINYRTYAAKKDEERKGDT